VLAICMVHYTCLTRPGCHLGQCFFISNNLKLIYGNDRNLFIDWLINWWFGELIRWFSISFWVAECSLGIIYMISTEPQNTYLQSLCLQFFRQPSKLIVRLSSPPPYLNVETCFESLLVQKLAGKAFPGKTIAFSQHWDGGKGGLNN